MIPEVKIGAHVLKKTVLGCYDNIYESVRSYNGGACFSKAGLFLFFYLFCREAAAQIVRKNRLCETCFALRSKWPPSYLAAKSISPVCEKPFTHGWFSQHEKLFHAILTFKFRDPCVKKAVNRRFDLMLLAKFYNGSGKKLEFCFSACQQILPHGGKS